MFAFIVQLGATLAMTGIIWMVQVVHYPLFAQVGPQTFAQYHEGHTRLISWIVVPLMLAELSTAGWAIFARPAFFEAWAVWTGLGLVGLIWGSTFFGQVPLHGALSGGFDAGAHQALVAGNWIRTLAWTGRGALLLAVLGKALEASTTGAP